MFIGIDPGILGAWAAVTRDGALEVVGDIPVVGSGAQKTISGAILYSSLASFVDAPSKAALEQVHAMPGQGVSSTFRFGRAYGIIEGVLCSMGLPILHISPAKWKKALGLSSDKEQSRLRAIQMWPDQAELFARKKDHQRAEAALLAYYASKQEY